jgi:hypothetical protein
MPAEDARHEPEDLPGDNAMDIVEAPQRNGRVSGQTIAKPMADAENERPTGAED